MFLNKEHSPEGERLIELLGKSAEWHLAIAGNQQYLFHCKSHICVYVVGGFFSNRVVVRAGSSGGWVGSCLFNRFDGKIIYKKVADLEREIKLRDIKRILKEQTKSSCS